MSRDGKAKIKRKGQSEELRHDRAVTASVALCVFAAVMAAAGGYLAESREVKNEPVIECIIEETSARERESSGAAYDTAAETTVKTAEKAVEENAAAAAVGVGEKPVGDGLININTATAEELESLYGIGEKLAAAIIEYRAEKPFKTIEEIMDVKGIGEGKFEKIKDKITC